MCRQPVRSRTLSKPQVNERWLGLSHFPLPMIKIGLGTGLWSISGWWDKRRGQLGDFLKLFFLEKKPHWISLEKSFLPQPFLPAWNTVLCRLVFESAVAMRWQKMAEEKNPVWVLDDIIVLLTLPSPDFLVGQNIKHRYCWRPWETGLLFAAECTLMLQPCPGLKRTCKTYNTLSWYTREC